MNLRLLKLDVLASGRGMDIRKNKFSTYVNVNLIEQVYPETCTIYLTTGRTLVLTPISMGAVLKKGGVDA